MLTCPAKVYEQAGIRFSGSKQAPSETFWEDFIRRGFKGERTMRGIKNLYSRFKIQLSNYKDLF